MPKYNKPSGIPYRQPVSLGDIIEHILSTTPLGKEMMADDICRAWDKVSGIRYGILSREYNDGVLYVTFGSSALRNMTFPRKQSLMSSLNAYLRAIPKFADFDTPVREIVFK